tara:strand:- start:10012 stop:10173 length:162 start_codon:yes stop_codon:yes gene_type:complete
LSADYDWKNKPSGWPFKGDAPNDPDYIKERNKLFNENGNGWWWGQKAVEEKED